MERSSKRGTMTSVSHGGRGEARRVFDLVRADGHVCRRRCDNCVHRVVGTVSTLKRLCQWERNFRRRESLNLF